MEQGMTAATPERIRFSAHISIATNGHINVEYDVTAPERKPEPLPVQTIPGIEINTNLLSSRRRGGWPKGRSRKPAKKSKSRR